MTRLFGLLRYVLIALALTITGCGTSAPAPAPTQPPAKAAEPTKAPAATTAPAKAAEPTKAAAAQPTTAPAAAAPAKKSDYPNKPITYIVPFAAGGGGDTAARMLSPLLEKELGQPVQVVNRGGAGGQLGFEETAKSKPDGYTIVHLTLPHVVTTAYDPARKAIYSRKSFDALMNHSIQPIVVSVNAESPYKSLKDLVDAAKSNPGKIKFASGGLQGPGDLGIMLIQKIGGVRFATAQLNGGAAVVTELLGGHIDAGTNPSSEVLGQVKAGKLRTIAVLDAKPLEDMPDVKTAEAQGYKVSMATISGVAAPAGLPKEVFDTLVGALKRSVANPEWQAKMKGLSQTLMILDPEQYSAKWAQVDAEITPIIQEALKQQ